MFTGEMSSPVCRSKKGRYLSKKQHHKLQKFLSNKSQKEQHCNEVNSGVVVSSDHTYTSANDAENTNNNSNEKVTEDSLDVDIDIGSLETVQTYEIYNSEEEEEFNRNELFTWKDGRRIVEFEVLVDGLRNGCHFCLEPLSLTGIWSERRFGLGSLLSIKCSKGHITHVLTGKRHTNLEATSSKSRTQAWDINTKLALGMVHVGIGEKKVADLFSTLNIPFPHKSTLKKKEREVGPIIETVAQKSCSDAALKEKEQTELDEVTASGVTASFDAGWQKRGSGRSYSSLSGHAALIGKKTGKCLMYATRNKFCRTCDFAERNKMETKEHDCRKNWSGSSKAMEPVMCVSMIQNLRKENICVDTLVMDNDTTTISRVRSEVDPSIKKQCDKNHTMKELTNRLYELKNRKRYKELNPKTISHISKCFRYCVGQNAGNASALQKGISAIGQHVYGIHDTCDQSWCGYLQSPDTYRPLKLPYRKYLSDPNLKSDLQIILQDFSTHADKLADLGSSQANESLNNTIASKAPKAIFYSGSESNDYRVAAAVAQKNIGYQYVTQVNDELLLSPGKTTKNRADKNDGKRMKEREKEQTIEEKRRRVQKKENKLSHQASCEMREGITYKTGVDLNDNQDEDITEIPELVTQPEIRRVPEGEYTPIYFDLETTGLNRDSHITQIAAVCGEDKFDQYIIPKCKISASATAVTGLAATSSQLFKNGKPVTTKPLCEALSSFRQWLANHPNSVLVAHNAKFDSEVLCNAIISAGITDDFITGFVDSLSLFRKKIPNRTSYKQNDLAKDLLTLYYDAHDALADASTLQKLVESIDVTSTDLLDHSFSFRSLYDKIVYDKMKCENVKSLQILLQKNAVSKFTMNKIAGSGLSMGHLRLAHRRDPLNGIKNLLSEKKDGKVRVTCNGKIIFNIFTHFQLENTE